VSGRESRGGAPEPVVAREIVGNQRLSVAENVETGGLEFFTYFLFPARRSLSPRENGQVLRSRILALTIANVKGAIVKSTNAAPLVQRQKPQKKSFENVKYFCGPRAISPTK